MNVIVERIPFNVHFKKTTAPTYMEQLKQMETDGQVSLRGLRKDATLFDEIVIDVNTMYFERNGFWGKDINKARNFIERNKSKIKMISFSYDQFHKEFIDLQNILNIVDIANDLEVSTEIVGCFLKDGIQPGDIINEMGEHAFKTNYAYQPVINTGSAEIFSDSQFIKVIDLKKHEARCIGLLDRTLLINAKLEVYPCCSQVVENTLLLMGNLHEESLSAIIQSIDYNKVLHKIYTEGFTPFLELLKKKNIEYPQSLTSPCELCGFLFKDDWFLRLLKEEGYFENI